MEVQNDSVNQTETGSAESENANNVNEVNDNAAEAMPNDFKKDFFKQKQLMRDAQAEKEELAKKVRMFEEQEAERQGNHQKIIDTLKEENAKLRKGAEDSKKAKQMEKFNKTLSNKASEMGFTKPDRILNFLSSEDKELLSIDADYNIDEYGLEKAMDSVKKEWGELFRPKNVRVADGVVRTNLNKTPPKSAKEMTSAERMAMVRDKLK